MLFGIAIFKAMEKKKDEKKGEKRKRSIGEKLDSFRVVMEEASSLGLHWNQKTPDDVVAEFELNISENIDAALFAWTARVERARKDTKLAKSAKQSANQSAKSAKSAKESDDSEYDSEALAYERKLDRPLARRRLACNQLGGV